MKKIILIGAVASSSLLTSCASVVHGSHQTISIATSPVQGAQCHLENDKGQWALEKTPSSIVVHKSKKDLIIICKKKGFNEGTTHVKSSLDKAVFGNIILGGLIGLGVDIGTSAAFQYPMSVTVPLAVKK